MTRLVTAALMVVLACSMEGQPSSSTTISGKREETKALRACAQMVIDQLKDLKIPEARNLRFQGKTSEATTLCRGGEQALLFRGTPWVDWGNYWEPVIWILCPRDSSRRNFQRTAEWPGH